MIFLLKNTLLWCNWNKHFFSIFFKFGNFFDFPRKNQKKSKYVEKVYNCSFFQFLGTSFVTFPLFPKPNVKSFSKKCLLQLIVLDVHKEIWSKKAWLHLNFYDVETHFSAKFWVYTFHLGLDRKLSNRNKLFYWSVM